MNLFDVWLVYLMHALFLYTWLHHDGLTWHAYCYGHSHMHKSSPQVESTGQSSKSHPTKQNLRRGCFTFPQQMRSRNASWKIQTILSWGPQYQQVRMALISCPVSATRITLIPAQRAEWGLRVDLGLFMAFIEPRLNTSRRIWGFRLSISNYRLKLHLNNNACLDLGELNPRLDNGHRRWLAATDPYVEHSIRERLYNLSGDIRDQVTREPLMNLQ